MKEYIKKIIKIPVPLTSEIRHDSYNRIVLARYLLTILREEQNNNWTDNEMALFNRVCEVLEVDKIEAKA